jgi:predicted amidohydrolase
MKDGLTVALVPWTLLALTASSCDPDLLVPNFADANSATLGYDDSGADLWLKVATVALDVSRDPEENLAAMEAQVTAILEDDPEVELVLFGETTLGWYYVPDDAEPYQRTLAQPIPGDATDRVAALAAGQGVAIAFGMAEENGEELYNSLVLIDEQGEIAALARKQALIPWDVQSGYTPGEETTIVELGELSIGLAICNDTSHQPLVEHLAAEEVDIILHAWATNLGNGSDVDPLARMTGAWVVASNRYGDEGEQRYNGDIFVSDPAGTRRVQQRDQAGWLSFDMGVYR